MPTILPPKRRKIRSKKPEIKLESVIQHFKEESVTERLATEFKRHNWLEKKIANKDSHDAMDTSPIIAQERKDSDEAKPVASQKDGSEPLTPVKIKPDSEPKPPGTSVLKAQNNLTPDLIPDIKEKPQQMETPSDTPVGIKSDPAVAPSSARNTMAQGAAQSK